MTDLGTNTQPDPALRAPVIKAQKAVKPEGMPKTVRIILEESEMIPPTGLFLQHNGRAFMIRPGEPVDVPDFLISVLKDAVMSSPIMDPDTNQVLGYRNRLRYNFQYVNED